VVALPEPLALAKFPVATLLAASPLALAKMPVAVLKAPATPVATPLAMAARPIAVLLLPLALADASPHYQTFIWSRGALRESRRDA
jgi:hypothetical protein